MVFVFVHSGSTEDKSSLRAAFMRYEGDIALAATGLADFDEVAITLSAVFPFRHSLKAFFLLESYQQALSLLLC